jgi:hypothetical protein
MQNIRIDYQEGSFALAAPRFTQNIVLSQGVPQLIAKPTGARLAFFSKNADFYASYVHLADQVSTVDLSELVTNGAFATDTDWTKGTGWTIGSGVASSDGTQSADSDLEQTPTKIIVGQAYYVTFTVSNYSAGNITPVIGTTEGTDRAANGTFSETIIASAGGNIALRADLDFVGDVDDLTITHAAKEPAVNNLVGSGAELNPTVRDLSLVSDFSLVTPDISGARITINYYA